MNANELRIGNWLLSPKGEPFQVYDFWSGQNGFVCRPLGLGSEHAFILDKCAPLSLSAEWLLRFGFKWENDKKIHIELEMPDKKLDGGSRMCFYQLGHSYEVHCQLYQDGYLDGIFTTFAIDHVHQLQNLYFALTGEEIEIK